MQDAFGPDTHIQRHTYTVVARGLPLTDIPNDINSLTPTINDTNGVVASKAIALRPRRASGTKGAVLLHFESLTDANKLCDDELLLHYSVFYCEPYAESARPLQPLAETLLAALTSFIHGYFATEFVNGRAGCFTDEDQNQEAVDDVGLNGGPGKQRTTLVAVPTTWSPFCAPCV